jgi:hypothetical protein
MNMRKYSRKGLEGVKPSTSLTFSLFYAIFLLHCSGEEHMELAFIERQREVLAKRRDYYLDVFGGKIYRDDIYIGFKAGYALQVNARALGKLDEGTYGVCDTCGGAIPEARLEVSPGALNCLECQLELEKTTNLERDLRISLFTFYLCYYFLYGKRIRTV